MVPSLLLVGVAAGVLVRDRTSLLRAAVVGGAISALWGIVIGIADASAATAFGGAALGLINVLVGAAVSAAIGTAWRAVATRNRQRRRKPTVSPAAGYRWSRLSGRR